MLQLAILSGRLTATTWSARGFPVTAGRAHGTDLRLEEPGVWDRHLEIRLQLPHGFFLTALPGASVSINGQPIKESVLRHGDLIELGAVKLRFGFEPARQSRWRFREGVTWLALATLAFAQVFLIYALLF